MEVAHTFPISALISHSRSELAPVASLPQAGSAPKFDLCSFFDPPPSSLYSSRLLLLLLLLLLNPDLAQDLGPEL